MRLARIESRHDDEKEREREEVEEVEEVEVEASQEASGIEKGRLEKECCLQKDDLEKEEPFEIETSPAPGQVCRKAFGDASFLLQEPGATREAGHDRAGGPGDT